MFRRLALLGESRTATMTPVRNRMTARKGYAGVALALVTVQLTLAAITAFIGKAPLLTEVEPRASIAPDHFQPEFAFRQFEKRFAGTMQRHEIIGANLLQG